MPPIPVTLSTAPPPPGALDLDGLSLHVSVEGDGQARVEHTSSDPGLTEVTIEVTGGRALLLDWQLPVGGATTYWQPDWGQHRHLPAEWSSHRSVSLLRSAPVGSLVDAADRSVLTWAISEMLHRVEIIREGVREEDAVYRITVAIPVSEDSYRVVLRLDRRALPYWETLAATATWWDADLPAVPGCPPAGLDPVYCTWYSRHQQLTDSTIERDAEMAAELGFRTIIVDDGWQTADSGRGYWYCGDWRPEPSKIPDLAGHVRRVKDTGLAYLLWLAPPLLGRRSPARNKLAGGRPMSELVLGSLGAGDADVLDPRYPAVRRELTEACVRLLEGAGLDGFKLDFLDAWLVADPPAAGAGADVSDVESGVLRWLGELRERLDAVRPGVLLEFRQDYTGPLMQRYGNLFRACDCPMDTVDNRIRTVDLRLLLPGRVVHADPLLWNPAEPAAVAAEQLLCGMFAVPQVSVDPATLPGEHRRMLSFWLRWLREHADTLVTAPIRPSRPELAYPQVRARGTGETIVASYGSMPVELEPGKVWVVNGTGLEGVLVEVPTGLRASTITMTDHCGDPAPFGSGPLRPGIHRVPVPRSGLVELRVV
jgi:alpha-galactosidase